MGVLGDPGQIGLAIESLLNNGFISGQILYVDGGEFINTVGRNVDAYALERQSGSSAPRQRLAAA